MVMKGQHDVETRNERRRYESWRRTYSESIIGELTHRMKLKPCQTLGLNKFQLLNMVGDNNNNIQKKYGTPNGSPSLILFGPDIINLQN